jgi:thiosulfate/3-mercaptopyruvate sulfurtransferase
MRARRAAARFARVVLGLLVVRAGGAHATGTESTPPAEIFVTPAQAWTLAGEGRGVLLDVRSQVSFLLAHPAGAVRTSWHDFSDPAETGRLHPDTDRLAQRLGALGVRGDRPVVVIGAWDEGWGEEGRLFWMLEYLGHPAVHLVEGGFDAWLEDRLPLGVGTARPEPAAFAPRVVPERLALLDEVAALAQAPPGAAPAEVIDTRSAAEYAGATPFGSARGGHVPGARHLAWDELVSERRLLDRAELEARLPDRGLRTVLYCTGGVRSGFVYAVLRHLGRTDVANYAGSWWEYARSPHPVALPE